MNKLVSYICQCAEEGIIPNIHSEDLMNLEFLKPFIKRLVDNDKIDYKKLVEDNTWNILKENGGTNDIALLMLLSISDNPIDFLIEILK